MKHHLKVCFMEISHLLYNIDIFIHKCSLGEHFCGTFGRIAIPDLYYGFNRSVMKIQLEQLKSDDQASFSMMFNPRLSDLFFWHFHPEYELVYIEGANGTRHVGDHISSYKNCDLVLIGSNIPHLNFDYQVETAYSKVVVHFNTQFVEEQIGNTPELSTILNLFDLAKYGIAFTGNSRKEIGRRLFELESLTAFQQYLSLLDIMQDLAVRLSHVKLHETHYVNHFSEKEQDRIRSIYAHIDQFFHQKIELNEVAQICNLTKEAFCRYFKKTTGQTFVDFLNQYRISQAKRMMMSGGTVSDACYSCGFESLSYFNRVFKRNTGINPSQFKKSLLLQYAKVKGQ